MVRLPGSFNILRAATTLALLMLVARLECIADTQDATEPVAATDERASAGESDAPPDPAGGGGSSVIELVAPVAPPRARRLVYACREGSIAMFSDRPCGSTFDTRSLDLAPAASAGRAPSTRAAAPAAATRPIAKPAPPADRPVPVDRCDRLRDQLATIDDRMRQGYTARETARLWDRWREAKSRLRDARC
jgi:hypothetical protein